MPSQQFFSFIIRRRSNNSMIMTSWWCLLCTRSTRLVGFSVLSHWKTVHG